MLTVHQSIRHCAVSCARVLLTVRRGSTRDDVHVGTVGVSVLHSVARV